MVSGSTYHENFPVLVSFTDTDLRTVANGGNVESASGFDILFLDEENGEQLAHEIEDYSATSGLLLAWVRIPRLYAGVSTDIRMIYGNDDITTDPSTDKTWDSGYQGVWHLHDDFNDATSVGNDGTNNGSADATGFIADGPKLNPLRFYICRMKYSLALVAISLILSACTNEPERVVENEWTPEQPKLVAFYIEENDVKFKQSEEKYYEDGTMEYSGSYDAEGARHGEWKYYYTNGNIWSIGNYANGAKTGIKEVYWPEGQMRYQGLFAEDLKSGHWTFYDTEGVVIDEQDY